MRDHFALSSSTFSTLLQYLAGLATGLAVALSALPLGFIAGTGGKWLHPDNDYNAYLVAWNYFVLDAWRFPLFDLPAMGYPEGGSVLFNDALPIAALPTKILYELTGDRINPFGWWILLTYALQGVFAVRVVRALGVRSLPAAASAAALAVCTMPFMWRFQHTAISSHFLILWALALYFETVRSETSAASDPFPRPVPPVRFVELWVLSAASLLINSYLFAMVMVLHGTTLLTLWWRRRFGWRELALSAAGCAIVVGVGIAAGYGLFLTNPSTMRSTGFGLYSWNLVGLLVPPSVVSLRDGTGGQYEGEAWIGSGAVLVLAVSLLWNRRALVAAARRHRVLCAALLLMTIYAASNKVYFSDTLLVSYYLPDRAIELGNYFRATGRFIWPLAYVLILVPLAGLFRWWPRPAALAVVIVAALVQVDSARPAIRHFRTITSQPMPDLIDHPRVEAWMRAHQRLFQYPSWSCGGLAGTKRRWGNVEANRELQVQLLAAEVGLPTNSVYTSRLLKSCPLEFSWGPQPELEEGVLYLLGREMVATSPSLVALAGSTRCVHLEWTIACSRAFGQ